MGLSCELWLTFLLVAIDAAMDLQHELNDDVEEVESHQDPGHPGRHKWLVQVEPNEQSRSYKSNAIFYNYNVLEYSLLYEELVCWHILSEPYKKACLSPKTTLDVKFNIQAKTLSNLEKHLRTEYEI